jgi:hypothetical protein
MKKLFTFCIAVTILLSAVGATNAYCAQPVSIRFQNEESSLGGYKRDIKRYCANFCRKIIQPNIKGCIKASKHLIKS